MFTEDKYSPFLGREGDYYIIRQPIPWPLAESNSYLIESADGWTVIDGSRHTGYSFNMEKPCRK